MSQSNMKFTDEQLINCLQQGLSNRAIGRKFNVDEAGVRRRKTKLLNQGILTDNTSYALPAGHQLRGVTYKANDKGELEPYWVKSKNIDSEEKDIERLKEKVEAVINSVPARPTIDRYSLEVDDNLLACYPLGDRHIGMMAWKAECGKDWDLKIAKRVLCETFEKVVKRAPPCKRALIVDLGDYLHSDNLEGFTMRSKNILDMDSRYPKMIDVGIEIFLFMIDKCLEHHEEVDVEILPGNHNEIGGVWMVRVLVAHYRDNPRVNIKLNEAPIHCYQWGKVMLAMHHGHTIKMQQMPGTCAADYPKIWGNTIYRYGLMGHIHKDSQFGDETSGMKVNSFRTLAAADSYAKWHGYRSGCDTKVIVYHKEDGQVEEYTINIK